MKALATAPSSARMRNWKGRLAKITGVSMYEGVIGGVDRNWIS